MRRRWKIVWSGGVVILLLATLVFVFRVPLANLLLPRILVRMDFPDTSLTLTRLDWGLIEGRDLNHRSPGETLLLDHFTLTWSYRPRQSLNLIQLDLLAPRLTLHESSAASPTERDPAPADQENPLLAFLQNPFPVETLKLTGGEVSLPAILPQTLQLEGEWQGSPGQRNLLFSVVAENLQADLEAREVSDKWSWQLSLAGAELNSATGLGQILVAAMEPTPPTDPTLREWSLGQILARFSGHLNDREVALESAELRGTDWQFTLPGDDQSLRLESLHITGQTTLDLLHPTALPPFRAALKLGPGLVSTSPWGTLQWDEIDLTLKQDSSDQYPVPFLTIPRLEIIWSGELPPRQDDQQDEDEESLSDFSDWWHLTNPDSWPAGQINLPAIHLRHAQYPDLHLIAALSHQLNENRERRTEIRLSDQTNAPWLDLQVISSSGEAHRLNLQIDLPGPEDQQIQQLSDLLTLPIENSWERWQAELSARLNLDQPVINGSLRSVARKLVGTLPLPAAMGGSAAQQLEEKKIRINEFQWQADKPTDFSFADLNISLRKGNLTNQAGSIAWEHFEKMMPAFSWPAATSEATTDILIQGLSLMVNESFLFSATPSSPSPVSNGAQPESDPDLFAPLRQWLPRGSIRLEESQWGLFRNEHSLLTVPLNLHLERQDGIRMAAVSQGEQGRLEFDFSLGQDSPADLTWGIELPSWTPPDGFFAFLRERLAPALPAGTKMEGLQLTGTGSWRENGPAPLKASIRVDHLQISEPALTLADLKLAGSFLDALAGRTGEPWELSIGQLTTFDLPFTNLYARASAQNRTNVFIQEVRGNWRTARFSILPLLINPSRPEGLITLNFQHLDLGEILRLFPELQTTGEGKLEGRVSFFVAPGRFRVLPGRLALEPGEKARLSINYPSLLTSGVSRQSREYAVLRQAERSLENLLVDNFLIDLFSPDTPQTPVIMNFRAQPLDERVAPVDLQFNVHGPLDIILPILLRSDLRISF